MAIRKLAWGYGTCSLSGNSQYSIKRPVRLNKVILVEMCYRKLGQFPLLAELEGERAEWREGVGMGKQ